MSNRTDKLAALQLAIKIEKHNLIERKGRLEEDLEDFNEGSPLYALTLGMLKEVELSIDRCERWKK